MTDMNDTEKTIEYLKTFTRELQEASKNAMFAHEACACLMAINGLNGSPSIGAKMAADSWVMRTLKLLDKYGSYLYSQSIEKREKTNE